jgi:hypothetical protein
LVGATPPTQLAPVENCVPVFSQKIVVWAQTRVGSKHAAATTKPSQEHALPARAG